MNKDKKNVCIGLLAHVDAGKTTLSEALLYQAGCLLRYICDGKREGNHDFFQAGSFFVGGYAGDVIGYAGAY